MVYGKDLNKQCLNQIHLQQANRVTCLDVCFKHVTVAVSFLCECRFNIATVSLCFVIVCFSSRCLGRAVLLDCGLSCITLHVYIFLMLFYCTYSDNCNLFFFSFSVNDTSFLSRVPHASRSSLKNAHYLKTNFCLISDIPGHYALVPTIAHYRVKFTFYIRKSVKRGI